MESPITITARIRLIQTSVLLIARILPNIKDVTSVFNPLVKDVTNIPSASELEEINAIEASPFKFVEELTFNKRNAAKMQTGIETASGAQLNAIAIAIVPKATWLNPSPIIENLFKTRIIPKSAAHTHTPLDKILGIGDG